MVSFAVIEAVKVAKLVGRYVIIELRKFFFASRSRHTRSDRDWSSDVCSSDLVVYRGAVAALGEGAAIDDERQGRVVRHDAVIGEAIGFDRHGFVRTTHDASPASHRSEENTLTPAADPLLPVSRRCLRGRRRQTMFPWRWHELPPPPQPSPARGGGSHRRQRLKNPPPQ